MLKNRSLWPIGIMLIVLVVIGKIIWTLNLVSNSKVYMDNRYFEDDYMKIDESYNDIQILQREFKNRYEIRVSTENLKVGDNTVKFYLQDKDGANILDADAAILLTRPHTSEDDMELKALAGEDGIYQTQSFEIDSVGRWQLMYKVKIDNTVGFLKQDINATK